MYKVEVLYFLAPFRPKFYHNLNKMDEHDTSYNFLYNGKEILMRRSVVTAERLGRYFNVSVSKLYKCFIFVWVLVL